jgi:hypothetical protein
MFRKSKKENAVEELPLIPNPNCPTDWRLNREVRFTRRQQRSHEWINFREIAEWLSEIDGHGVPNEAARANAYDMLTRDLLAGDFEEEGRSKVRYLYHASKMARMTRQRLNDVLDTFSTVDVRSEYLARCWIPRRMFDQWLAKHCLQASPRRFQPVGEQLSAHLRKPRRGRPAEYNWDGVKSRLADYVSRHGPVRTSDELLQKCADFATELHPKKSTPSDKTIREAIKTHALDATARIVPGK